jgi:hypothetical protein
VIARLTGLCVDCATPRSGIVFAHRAETLRSMSSFAESMSAPPVFESPRRRDLGVRE